jgi:hypothetical protein
MLQGHGKIYLDQKTPVRKLLKWQDYKQAVPQLQSTPNH